MLFIHLHLAILHGHKFIGLLVSPGNNRRHKVQSIYLTAQSTYSALGNLTSRMTPQKPLSPHIFLSNLFVFSGIDAATNKTICVCAMASHNGSG